MIELNNKSFTNEILCKTTFFHIAEGGAMGEPGGIVFVTEDGKVYHANTYFGDLERTTLIEAFPVLNDCNFGLFGVNSVVPAGWKYVDLGAGNHLIVREDFFEKFKDMTVEYNKPVEYYQHWLEIALSIIKL